MDVQGAFVKVNKSKLYDSFVGRLFQPARLIGSGGKGILTAYQVNAKN
jgi:hypothetical protein